MGLFDQFPYTNFHELNLDWILKALKELEHTIEQSVAINALKYADPIQWNITSQYEKNTIVIDPQSGTAYISVQPVPSGVALTNEDYWTVVFDLGQFVVRASKNFANTYEAATTLTATVSTAAGGWIVWGDTLYKALVNITAGDSYVVGGNISHFTMEDIIGHLEDLTTTDKSNLVAAINEVVAKLATETQNRQAADITLQGNIDAETLARENATGDLSLLETVAKSNLVAAINEVNTKVLGAYDTADIRNYGGVADGSTDCTAAFTACMAANNMVYMPNYNNQAYVLGAITLTDGQSIIGTEGTKINTSASIFCTIAGNNIDIKNLIITTANNVFYINSGSKALSFIHIENVYSYGAERFIYDNTSAANTYTNLYVDRCAARAHKSYGVDLTKAFAFVLFNNVTIDSVGVVGQAPMFKLTNNAGCHFVRCEAEGGFSDGSHATHGGFVFQKSQAIWLERCLADTVDGTGFDFTNCQYVYMTSCAASLCGAHALAILSTTCLHFLVSNCYFGGRAGMTVTPPGSHGIYNFNDYINIVNCNIINMSGYAIADSGSGNHNQYKGINISNCNRSFVSSAGGGIVSDLISDIKDIPTFGSYRYRLCICNDVLYDTPIETTP